MANNRIYMRCRGCGAVLFLGKSNYGGYWYDSYRGLPLERKLNDFYEEHNYCDKVPTNGPWPYDEEYFPMPKDCGGCDGCFDIVYEDGLTSGYKKEEC